MPRWMRIVRGMIGTGLTFAVGVGAVVGAIGTALWLAGGPPFVEVLRTAGKFSVVSFLLGVAFSGVLAITARGQKFSTLSLRLVAGLGAAAGLLYFLFLSANGGRTWTLRLAFTNFALLLVMGAGSAVTMLLIARRTGAGSSPRPLSSGSPTRTSAPASDLLATHGELERIPPREQPRQATPRTTR